jgi:hypothetical protein
MTLKEITANLVDFFTSHAQINQVSTYDNKGFLGDRSKKYLIANIEYLESSISGKQRNDNFQITLADLLTPTSSNSFEIYSATSEIAEDFFSFLQNHPDFTFNGNSSTQKFTEDDGDRIAGLTFTVTLQTIRRQNRCAIPRKDDEVPLPNSRFNYDFPYSLD